MGGSAGRQVVRECLFLSSAPCLFLLTHSCPFSICSTAVASHKAETAAAAAAASVAAAAAAAATSGAPKEEDSGFFGRIKGFFKGARPSA